MLYAACNASCCMLYGQVPTEAEAAMLAAAVTADAKLAEPEQYFHMLATLDR